ncbi:unnamed protein product [Coregonus sp. 'balchen']|nr:unnamed protein product [Coregonus sp. 'balchen']
MHLSNHQPNRAVSCLGYFPQVRPLHNNNHNNNDPSNNRDHLAVDQTYSNSSNRVTGSPCRGKIRFLHSLLLLPLSREDSCQGYQGFSVPPNRLHHSPLPSRVIGQMLQAKDKLKSSSPHPNNHLPNKVDSSLGFSAWALLKLLPLTSHPLHSLNNKPTDRLLNREQLSKQVKLLTTTTEEQTPPQQPLQQQQQTRPGGPAKPGQGRPQIQRTKQVEVQSSQDGVGEKDPKGSQKGFLSGLFGAMEEAPTTKAQEIPISPLSKEEPKTSTSGSSPGFLDRLLPKQNKDEIPISAAPSAAPTIPTSLDTSGSQVPQYVHNGQDPAVSPTQRYLEEVHRLLYGTAEEYGYQDLLYNFAEYGVIPPELYEHQLLIEALLWQQLNDYALSESLSAQVQECYQTRQGYIQPANGQSSWQNHGVWNPKDIHTSQFHIPSHPWRDKTAQPFQNGFHEPKEEDIVLFDMTCRNKKPWSSCDHLNMSNDISNHNGMVNGKPWIVSGSAVNLSKENNQTKRSRCQSLTEGIHGNIHEFGQIVNQNGLGRISPAKKDFDQNLATDFSKQIDKKSATEFFKLIAAKKGPKDLTLGAMDLSSSAGINGDVDDDMFVDESEWYQQWLSLLEQGMWWPAEAGDCGYYVYTDEEFIYSLLTDRAGKHLYACGAPEDVQMLGQITENLANILNKQKEKDKVTLCGFKIPLYNEEEAFWAPGRTQRESHLLNAPEDLTSAFKKGDKIMNMNMESFSQMFQESVVAQTEQPVDFSVFKLRKVKMETNQTDLYYHEEPLEAADLTSKSQTGSYGGPYWQNHGIKGATKASHHGYWPNLTYAPNCNSGFTGGVFNTESGACQTVFPVTAAHTTNATDKQNDLCYRNE